MWRTVIRFSILISLLFPSGALAEEFANKRFVFQEQTGDDVTQYEIRVTSHEEGYRIHGTFPDRTTYIECDAALAHHRLEIDRNAVEHLIVYTRDGNSITGTLGDETLTKKINDNPWYQMLEVSQAFVTGQGDLGDFWIVSDQMGEHTDEPGFSAITLQAREKGRETIEIQGQEVEALKVIVRLTGAKAMFWKAEYWYRPSDGVMLRYEAVRGGPGTPKTVITLLEEEELAAQE